MGCCSSAAATKVFPNNLSVIPSSSVEGGEPSWTKGQAEKLQDAVDRAFSVRLQDAVDKAFSMSSTGPGITELPWEGKISSGGLDFSFTIADPSRKDVPIVGCSSGFCTLTGYSLQEILDRNCRFLIDPVPPHLIDKTMRKHVRDYCMAMKAGKPYFVPSAEREPWMPENRPGDELFCMQVNAKKDGTLFNNLFYLRAVHLGGSLAENAPFIVGLQSSLPSGKADLAALCQNLSLLDANMKQIIDFLAGDCFVAAGFRRS